jgi:hypothetical protein
MEMKVGNNLGSFQPRVYDRSEAFLVDTLGPGNVEGRPEKSLQHTELPLLSPP